MARLPAYARELAIGRRRGLRPQTPREMFGTHETDVIIPLFDSWLLAQHYRSRGWPAIVVEPGQEYDFAWASGWVIYAITRASIEEMRQTMRAAGAIPILIHDPDWVIEREQQCAAPSP